MAKNTVLVVDDERDILELIRYNLEKEDFHVRTVGTGEDALRLAREIEPDLIILDIMLSGINGTEVCKRLKAAGETRNIPVLMLTAKSASSDVVNGLELGADDYVTKPFIPSVLLARVRAVLRRAERSERESAAPARIRVHDILIDVSRHEVSAGDTPVPLSATEFAILEFLARNPGWVFSRNRIIDAVRGEDYPVTERSVDVQILGLRKKLGDHGKHIETVRGVGYRLAGET
ncbi:MAG: response regulator [Spirochaetes bacterium]|nr:response regulator [Spirochaetota bacterium]